jgi:hypothetical protein
VAAAAGDGDPEIQLVARMITSLVSFLNVCGVAGGLFTAEEASKVQQQGRSFLLSYQTLAEEAYSTWQALWKLRPKIHYFAHMVEELPSTLENPGRCDTFDWESFVGTIKANWRQDASQDHSAQDMSALYAALGVQVETCSLKRAHAAHVVRYSRAMLESGLRCCHAGRHGDCCL